MRTHTCAFSGNPCLACEDERYAASRDDDLDTTLKEIAGELRDIRKLLETQLDPYGIN